MDYYAVLGVPRNASIEEIERAYRAMARKVHPDRNTGDAERADARMKQLNQIREILTDPLLRAAYDDRLRQDDGPAPPPPPREPPGPSAEDRWRRPTPPRPGPHPHVAPFLHTQAQRERAAVHPRPDARSALGLVLVGGITLALVALLWPSSEPDPVEAPRPTPPVAVPAPRPHRPPEVEVIRGDTAAVRQAIRRTAKVVPVGFTLDEVIGKFGRPDRIESHPAPGDVTLIYGEVRVELKDGKVVGGAP